MPNPKLNDSYLPPSLFKFYKSVRNGLIYRHISIWFDENVDGLKQGVIGRLIRLITPQLKECKIQSFLLLLLQ